MTSPAETLLAQESRVRYGRVPRAIGGIALDDPDSALIGDAFLLRTGTGLGYYYRKGEGVVIERAPGASATDESLWLNGSVYAAIASINGFLPLHASAVAHAGRVYAFTGPSGSGKSTLIAGLGARGLPMFCDDTLVLDISAPDAITCLPGHKRLKLGPEALALTGAEPEEPVGAATGKSYARPPGGDVRVPLPLAMLVFIEEGPGPAWRPITGGERIGRLQDDHYTAELFDRARNLDRHGRFALHVRLAQAIRMARFVRPRDADRFQSGLDCVIAALSRDGANQ